MAKEDVTHSWDSGKLQNDFFFFLAKCSQALVTGGAQLLPGHLISYLSPETLYQQTSPQLETRKSMFLLSTR